MTECQKSIVVTGASGFIGRHVLPRLVARGWQVHAISSQLCPSEEAGIHWHTVDLLHEYEAARLLDTIRPSHLLHLAWYAEPGKYWHSNQNYRWLKASIDLAQAFAVVGGKRLVAAGTCAEYDWRYGFCRESDTPLNPASAYGVCKNSLRQILSVYGRDHQMQIAWGRVFFLYGPYEHRNRLVPSVINTLLKGKSPRCSEGRQLRDFLYVDDVASAFVFLVESEAEGDYNIGSGYPVSVHRIVTEIAEQIPRSGAPRFGVLPLPDNEPPLLAASSERLRALDWQPEIELAEGLRRSIAWWLQIEGVQA